MSDSLVRCRDCGREEYIRLQMALRNGWPKCYCREPRYGMTMHLEHTDADVDAAIRDLMAKRPPTAQDIIDRAEMEDLAKGSLRP